MCTPNWSDHSESVPSLSPTTPLPLLQLVSSYAHINTYMRHPQKFHLSAQGQHLKLAHQASNPYVHPILTRAFPQHISYSTVPGQPV